MRVVVVMVAALLATACGSSSAGDPDGNVDSAGGRPDASADASADAGDPDAGPVPAGDRVLAIEVNEPPGFDHGEQITVAKGIGAAGIQLTMPWSFLEPNVGERDLSFLEFGMGFYRDQGLSVLLSIPTIDTVAKLVPADLAALPMDDPAVIARFESLLGDVLGVTGDELDYLVIGNEVDIYLGSRPQGEWIEFKAFVDAGIARVNSLAPEIEVGISVHFGGIPDARITALTENVDAMFLTYYFIGNDFGGTPADNVQGDIGDMVSFAGGKPLVIKEFGYPTGPATGGSEAGQAEFIREAFAAWDDHAASIPFLTISRMFDGVRSECETTAADYGFPGDEAFIQFLCTLGFRALDDRAKPAWAELVTLATEREF